MSPDVVARRCRSLTEPENPPVLPLKLAPASQAELQPTSMGPRTPHETADSADWLASAWRSL